MIILNLNSMVYKILFVSIAFFVSNLSFFEQENHNFSSKPNVLFIMVDDFRPELGSYGQTHIVTPNMDRLSKRGQTFTRAYVNYPTCGPSRASLLSGLYSSRSRFRSWNVSQDEVVPGLVSLPMHFRNNNYYTISLGKVYNNIEDGRGSWNEIWRPPLTTTMWDYQSENGIDIFKERNSERHKNLEVRNNNNLPNRGPAFEQPDVPDVAYRDGRIATHAIEKLQEVQNSSQPFFLAVGFHKPHLPFNAPRRYWDLYDEEDIQLAENPYLPKDGPETDFGEIRAYDGIPGSGSIPDNMARELIHGYYASVSYVDAQIGRVLDSLENLGLSDDTIVVLWGDHGFSLGENGLWGKHHNFHMSLHIPLIVHVPGTKSGVRHNGLVESVDIYPTLTDLAGLSKPVHVQGKSFAPMLTYSDLSGKDEVYARYGNNETIIIETHTYTEFYDSNGEFQDRMLFDLRDDPEENINIAGNPENEQLIMELSEKLKRHRIERNRIHLD